jgi:uncharacterized membrane protein HdeD (DUF308 family)
MEHDITSSAARPWKALVGRAVIVAAAAVAVTFSPDHSPAFGLAVIAAFAIVSGVLGVAAARRTSARAGTVTLVRSTGIATIAVGLLALAALILGLGLGALVLLIAAVGVIGAVSEFLRARKPEPGAPTVTDHRILGTVAALLVVGVLLANDNSVVVVGVFGAWAAVTAVFTLITAFTLKWEGDRRPDPMVNP